MKFNDEICSTVSIHGYWFWCDLLLAGDIEENPGPRFKYPCTLCSKPVKCNQMGICCDSCDLWTHAKCCGMKVDEYNAVSKVDWYCRQCLMRELPFSNSSVIEDDCVFDASDVSEVNGYQDACFGVTNTFGGLSKNGDLVFCHINIRSLLSKLDECKNMLLSSSVPLVFGVSETWLNDTVSDGLVSVVGYNLYRNDRKNRTGGGVLLWTSSKIRGCRRVDLEQGYDESVWAEVKINNKSVLIGVFYRPPNATVDCLRSICDVFEVAALEGKEVVIMGDFNLNLLSPTDMRKTVLLDCASECGFSQLIAEQTRITSHSSSLIDLLFVSNPSQFSSSGCLDVFGSDHCLIYSVLSAGIKCTTNHVKCVKCIKKCNVDDLVEELLDFPWNIVDVSESVDDMWEIWKASFNEIVDRHVPKRKVRVRVFTKPWMNDNIRKLMRARNYYCSKFRKHRRTDDWDIYKRLRNHTKSETRKAKIIYFDSLCTDGANVWKDVNDIVGRKHKRPVSVLKSADGECLDSDLDIANNFSQYFASMSGVDPCSNDMIDSFTDDCFTLEDVDESTVLSYISKLNTRKATGVDGLSAKILKLTSFGIVGSLTKLFNFCLNHCEIPTEWKSANVSPVFKKGKAEDVSNYRPISVLPVIAKLFEKIIYSQIYSYLADQNLFHSSQSGFRPSHSTSDALLKATDSWRIALDKNEVVGATFVDLSKAFDSINHPRLLMKLTAYGFSDSSLKLFKNYLSGRRQRVVVNGVYSDWRCVERGVPQGSVLGPLLFIMYINDLPTTVKRSTVDMYADDIVMYAHSKSFQEMKSCLEDDLGNVVCWLKANGLKMNVKKTNVLFLSRKGRRHLVKKESLLLEGVSIPASTYVKFLGVIVDDELTWAEHVKFIRQKCFACLASLRRIFPTLPVTSRKLLFNGMVLPHLDYCSTVWGRCSSFLKSKLDKIQNYALSLITSSPRLTSRELLRTKLKWMSLNSRRDMQIVLKVHSCLNQRSPGYLCSRFSQSFNLNYRCSRSTNKVQLSCPSTNFYRNSFEFYGAFLWNSLPSDIREIRNPATFKSVLSKYFLDISV